MWETLKPFDTTANTKQIVDRKPCVSKRDVEREDLLNQTKTADVARSHAKPSTRAYKSKAYTIG